MHRCLASAIRFALVATLAGAVVPASAEPIAPGTGQAEAAAEFAITPQPLSTALVAFGQQAKVQVLTAGANLDGCRTAGVSGRMSPSQALAKLLQGSGFVGHFSDAGTVVVKQAPVPPAPQRKAPPRVAASRRVAATDQNATTADAPPQELAKVTVLGSLIPRSQTETASPVTTITAEEIKARGFTSVADALQQTTFNTGAIQNTAQRTGDIWGAKTVSLFGLQASYTKFLLDGRPMAAFSPMSQSSDSNDLITNLTGIPIDMVDRIEILPGAQSSLYGSDAIAGVINIVLKKNTDSASVNARYSWYDEGGGEEHGFNAMGALNRGKFHLLAGAQYTAQEPIWTRQRKMGATTASGKPDLGFYALDLFSGSSVFLDPNPAPCSGLKSQWGGTMQAVVDPQGMNNYCGSPNTYGTLINRSRMGNVNLRARYDFSPRLQAYADLYYSQQEQLQHTFQYWMSPTYWDDNQQTLLFVFREFAPEEVVRQLDNKLDEKNITATVGVNGAFGNTWVYDVSVSHSGERAKNTQFGLRTGASKLQDYLLGPMLGPDPYGMGVPAYAPDYSHMYSPIPRDILAASLMSSSITSSTSNDQFRALLTGDSFGIKLPGGDAGIALLVEGGRESWRYQPDDALRSGLLSGVAFNPSGGSQNRAAMAMEWRLPVFKWLSLSPSARYDRYDAEGARFSKGTYSLGIEVRPFESLLLRGKYGTAFKAPSLVDQFEGINPPRRSSVYDYANCERMGYGGSGSAYNNSCPPGYSRQSAVVENYRNEHLKPITTTAWSYGVVYAPTGNFSLGVDYQHLDIRNEVVRQTPDSLLLTEAWCLDGRLDSNSPSCKMAFDSITRNAPLPNAPAGTLGSIAGVRTSKINLAREVNDSLTANLSYKWKLQDWGMLRFDAAYTNVMTHRRQIFLGDPEVDYLSHPGRSTEFRTRGNAGVTWDIGNWSSTLYGSYYGRTPNYAAVISDGYPVGSPAATIAPWTLYNASVSWKAMPKLQLSFRVNNLFNTMPRVDDTVPELSPTPYNAANYNVLGRWFSFEAKYAFGGSPSR